MPAPEGVFPAPGAAARLVNATSDAPVFLSLSSPHTVRSAGRTLARGTACMVLAVTRPFVNDHIVIVWVVTAQGMGWVYSTQLVAP